jgi:hypothetical protein
MVRLPGAFAVVIFRRKFEGQFNASVSGSDVLEGVLANPRCGGVRLNSAASLHSGGFPQSGQRKPWWRFW